MNVTWLASTSRGLPMTAAEAPFDSTGIRARCVETDDRAGHSQV